MLQQTISAPSESAPHLKKKLAPQKDRPRLCLSAPLRKLPNVPLKRMGFCPLPLHIPGKDLLASFQAAPQFSGIDPQDLLSRQLGSLRLILLSENEYYARQCALYLSTLALQERGYSPGGEADAFWQQLGLNIPEEDEDEETEDHRLVQALRSALAVVSASALDPELLPEAFSPRLMPPPRPLPLSKLAAPAAMICAPEGPVLTPAVLEQLQSFPADRDPSRQMDLTVVLKPGQVDWEHLEELRFTYGFQVCRVGTPDLAYLRQVLRLQAEDLLLPLDPQADLDQVIAHVQRLRGDKFTELDLSSLVLRAMQNQVQPPLTTADLLFQPYRPQAASRKELDAMVALEPVKEALGRLLAVSRLEKRRQTEGKPVHPACRNLAFSGPPGTGKSVTARLLARVMQEEGCGTGRFVEAGREQLIGSYLGQTSPMVAKLFQQARGGVLFIDEAGSLLCDSKGQDVYAVEAVNALVRHMELSPETMVIFATYPQEMEELLSSNPGLSSRVAQVLEFPGYDDGQLWDILTVFAQKEGYSLPPAAKEGCLDFFSALRRQKGPDFGNGREARRLFRAAVEELALRVREQPEEDADLLPADLERAAQRLLAQPCKQPRRTIGF